MENTFKRTDNWYLKYLERGRFDFIQGYQTFIVINDEKLQKKAIKTNSIAKGGHLETLKLYFSLRRGEHYFQNVGIRLSKEARSKSSFEVCQKILQKTSKQPKVYILQTNTQYLMFMKKLCESLRDIRNISAHGRWNLSKITQPFMSLYLIQGGKPDFAGLIFL